MIEPLGKRLSKEYNSYRQLVKAHVALDNFLACLPNHIPAPKSISVYSDILYVYYATSDVDGLEIDIIPALSDLFNLKWDKVVQSTYIEYKADAKVDGFTFNLKFTLIPEGTCQIVKHNTGRIKKTSQWLEVSLPEIVYEVTCSEED